MSIQLYVWERRDSADRVALGNAALDLCRSTRAIKGISSSKFYWYGPDTVVTLTEGETEALDAPIDADSARAVFALADFARPMMDWRLLDPRTGEETYRRAGR